MTVGSRVRIPLLLLAFVVAAASCAPHRRGRLPSRNQPPPLSRPADQAPSTTSPATDTTPTVTDKPVTESDRAAATSKAKTVCSEALSHVGTKYVYGGSSPRGFDCSGLVQYCFKKVGIKLPRRAIDQSRYGKSIKLTQARPGDLIFFAVKRGVISHVGIYLGENRFIHAPRSGKVVEVETLSTNWWRRRVKRVRRVLPG